MLLLQNKTITTKPLKDIRLGLNPKTVETCAC